MNTNNIGFIFLHIDQNQSIDIINNIKKISKITKDKKLVIFNSYNNSDIYNIPIMHINQCKFFEGDLFVFDVLGLMLAVSCYKVKNIYYYAYNTPWTMDSNTDFSFWSGIIEDERVKIIAQNQNIYNVYKKIWKTPLSIVGEFSSEELIRAI